MKNHRYSIIIPAYNAGGVITDTLKSISNTVQDYDVEVVIIDDGSTDDTASKIVNYHESSNLNIKLYSIKNAGPANARNIGIKKATGDFIIFLDADDAIEPMALEVINRNIAHHQDLDLIIFGFKITNSKEELVNTYSHSNAIASKDSLRLVLTELYKANLLNQVWNKVYRSKIVKSISFENVKYGEDRLFVLDYLRIANSIQVVDSVLYNYKIVNSESLISTFHENKLDITIRIDKRIRTFSKQIGADRDHDTAALDYMFFKGVVSCMTNLFVESCPYTRHERMIATKKILANPAVVELLRSRHFDSIYTKIISKIFISRNTLASYYLAKGIHTINQIAPVLFTKIKHTNKKGVE